MRKFDPLEYDVVHRLLEMYSTKLLDERNILLLISFVFGGRGRTNDNDNNKNKQNKQNTRNMHTFFFVIANL
jgi:hypothetical protein